MGFGISRPVAAATLPAEVTPLTIRNLTVTPLELKLVERLETHHRLSKVASHVSSRPSHELEGVQRPPSARPVITCVTIQPFSECPTAIDPPDPTRHEQLRLTFEDPSTGHRYSAEIPGPSRRSIVLTPHAPGPNETESKEFTAIYLADHGYLALFSSANLSSWMSTLDASLPISALSIPGTHNSPTCHVALPSVRCQAVSVLDQLNNGVRFLDVRVSCPAITTTTTTTNNPPDLTLVHSAFPVSLFTGPKRLSALLATLYAFLAAHPGETVLLSLKREGVGRGTDAHLARVLARHYIAPHRDRWYTSAAVPTLAASRGRIVLIRRFALDLAPFSSSSFWGGGGGGGGGDWGIDASAWPDNVADGLCGGGTVRIQDYYGVGRAGEIARKATFVKEGLERAAQGLHARPGRRRVVREREREREREGEGEDGEETGEGEEEPPPPPPLFINFLSASNFFNASCWPDRIAVKINPSIVEYLCMGHGTPGKGPQQLSVGDAATGIVVTDWVGHRGDWDLIHCIVGWNARLQLRQ